MIRNELSTGLGIGLAVALVLPWLLDRLGADPAFASAPLATVIQDLLSIAIFFGIARSVIG
jgi:magnesium transporter